MELSAVTSWRLSPAAYRRVTLLAVVAVGFIIVTGGAVRLTGSGLGCKQWPTCDAGHVVAPLSYHPMVEFVNRVMTGLVSVAIMVAALGAFARRPRRRDLTWLALGLVGGLLAQIVLGGLTVRHRLNPAFVMCHLILSMLIVWNAVVLHHRAGRPDASPVHPIVDRELLWMSRVIVIATALTVVAGTVVTGAGPHSGANGTDGQVKRWQLDLHRVTQIHGASAMLLVAIVATTWWVFRSQGAPIAARHRLDQLIEALACQVTIGYTQYFVGVPALLVAAHILGAVLVWTAALRFALVLRSPVPVAGQPRRKTVAATV